MGFLLRMLWGFLPGNGDLRSPVEVCDSERMGPEGTAEEARRAGFLCVWVEGSTFRRCEVTLSPEEIWEKTASIAPLDPSLPFDGALSKFGSGGGGGGPGAEEDGLGVWPDWTS